MTRDTYQGVVLGLIAGLLLAALLVVTVRASTPRSASEAMGLLGQTGVPSRAAPGTPTLSPVVTLMPSTRPTAEPVPTRSPGPVVSTPATKARQPAPQALRGVASWFAAPTGTAAAGPALRAALGPHWRGTVVTVTTNGHSVRVLLTDVCQCYGTRLIDLSDGDFARLAPLSAGLTVVTVVPA